MNTFSDYKELQANSGRHDPNGIVKCQPLFRVRCSSIGWSGITINCVDRSHRVQIQAAPNNFFKLQGDPCNSDECFWGISLKLVKVQSSIIVQKKRNSIGVYLIPGLSKSNHYFSRNRPESKFGQFHNLTLDAMDHNLCLRRQYQKIALESSITKIDYHAIPHFIAETFCQTYLSQTYWFYEHIRLRSY